MPKGVTPSTIARTIILLLALVNQMLGLSGHNLIPLEDETINALVTNIFTIGAALLAWWKNNSFTQSARHGDAAMQAHKSGATNQSPEA